ncbi:MAG: response regulator, partial [Dermatophilaceae bacterium]
MARGLHRQGGLLISQTPPPSSTTSSPVRALVVDDEPSLIRVVAGYLEHEGFVVTTAADGEQALAAAR